MTNNLIKFLEKLNIIPKNLELYYQAFTHPSFANENRFAKSYQRLEFLGDAIIEFLASDYVFKMFSKMDEGEMTIIRSKAVSGPVIADFAKKIMVDQQIRFGNNSENLRNSDKILADVFEAFVAAIYIDLGEEQASNFLKNNVFKFIENSQNKELKNPKTILQELLQSHSRESINYETFEKDNGFESTVYHDGHVFGRGFGMTKKEAEVDAANNSLKLLKK